MAQSDSRWNDVLLVVVGVVLGALGAAAYGAWRAVSESDAPAGERWGAFGEAMVFPGLLIVMAVAAVVWLGWKAQLD
ncbi:MAG: hypothetical protein WEC75_08370 [Dehalococcoidia bacterium]